MHTNFLSNGTHHAFSFRVGTRGPRNTMGAPIQANSRSQGGFEGHWLQGWFCTPLHTPLISMTAFTLFALSPKILDQLQCFQPLWTAEILFYQMRSCGDLSRVPKVTRMKWNSAKVHTPHLDRARSGRPFRAFTKSSWKHYGASWVQMFVDP